LPDTYEIAIGILVASGLFAAWACLRAVRRRIKLIDQFQNSIVSLEHGQSVRLSEVGPLGRLAKTLNDVAIRMQSRVSELERDQRQRGAVLEGMAEGVVAIDSRQRVLFANPAAVRLFGLKEDPVGRHIAEVIRTPRVQYAIEATVAGPDGYRDQITIPGPAGGPLGQELVLDVQGTTLPGSPPGAVLVFHDVTDLRRLETMRQDFVTNASHELKTPVAAIKAYAETLLDGGALHDEEVNVKFLRGIEEQADRLDLLIRDLLSLARLESGQDAFRHAPMHLSPFFRRCAESHRARAEAKGLDYAAKVSPDAESATVVVDEEAVRQILDNLLDNAIKYTHEGGHVLAELRLSGVDEVVLVVADSGIGIPREEQQRVFERFYRVDKGRSREVGGTGLGLSIVKHLVQSLGGRISLISRPGKGSAFSAYLPRTRAIAAAVRSRPDQAGERSSLDEDGTATARRGEHA
jgi:two-component system phosphate regulon sensor histidine kinase PhoR